MSMTIAAWCATTRPRCRRARQAAIVIDMFQHVHHQHEIALGRADVAAVSYRLARNGIVAVAIVADIDAQRRLRAGLCQQMAREEAGARPDIEDVTRLNAGYGA